MASVDRSMFAKYSRSGPYHWEHLRKDLRHHQCYTAARYAIVLELLADCRGKQVLDVGCGDGALTYLMAKKSALVTGCEPEPEGRRLAMEMFDAHHAEATFVSSMSGLTDCSFDIVVMAEVIEHLSNPREMLREIRRVLKPGGLCVMSTPIRLTERPFDQEHVQEFWPSEFSSLVSEHFTIKEHRLTMPVFWLELYYWRPFGLPIPKLIMNAMSAWFRIRLLCHPSPLGRYFSMQCIAGIKTV